MTLVLCTFLSPYSNHILNTVLGYYKKEKLELVNDRNPFIEFP